MHLYARRPDRLPQSTTNSVETGISGEQYIYWFADETRQDYRGIDYDEGELETTYGDLMKTPLMIKTQLQQSSDNRARTQNDRELNKNGQRESNYGDNIK